MLISCSEKEVSEQDVFLEISERKKFHIGESGITAEPRYFVSLDSSRSKGVIYNKFAHSLDSIFVSADSAWIKDGDIMENQGPYGVGNVLSFFTTDDHIVFMNPQQFFNQNKLTREVSMKFMHEFGIFGDTEYLGISVPTPSFAHELYGLDEDSGVGYFIFDDDNQIRVAGYKASSDSMFFLPVVLDSEKYFDLRYKVKYKGLIMGGGDEPQLNVVGNKLIISYPSFSDFLVYDLRSQEQNTFASSSNSFPSQRDLPQNYSDEVDSGELQWELGKLWGEEVRYGYFTYLGSSDKYIRLVKGGGGRDASNFIEVFDLEFQKTEEFNLTEMNPDISPDYLNTKYGLMFRAKDQPDEDVMYYYNINLADSK
ncbi:hypothetical protein [Algoriphagus sp. 4150]|uniref:hypothetical protein n=1 Tax=Algoriphagus sp. 4150 TaxID=2817756 RepID=UPI00286ABCAB|nr:hypothetical protein [Algoriphagus sp. 4150]